MTCNGTQGDEIAAIFARHEQRVRAMRRLERERRRTDRRVQRLIVQMEAAVERSKELERRGWR